MRIVLAALALPVLCWAEGGWVRLATPRFELYTNMDEQAGREALACFEQAHHAIRGGHPGLPLRVFLFNSAEDFEPYRSLEVALGYFLRGRNRNYIAIQYSGQNTSRIIFHEYAHLMIHSLKARLPHWLEEGTAEFYSTLQVNQSKLYAGVPARDHLLTLANIPLLDPKTFLIIDHRSPYFNERYQTGMFYSQSWALVHMLTMAPGYTERFPAFTAMLHRGVPQDRAFQQAFGKTMDAAFHDLARYLSAGRLLALELDARPIQFVRISPAGQLSDKETERALGELRRELGRQQ